MSADKEKKSQIEESIGEENHSINSWEVTFMPWNIFQTISNTTVNKLTTPEQFKPP